MPFKFIRLVIYQHKRALSLRIHVHKVGYRSILAISAVFTCIHELVINTHILFSICLDCMTGFGFKPHGCVRAQINTEGGSHIIGTDGEGGEAERRSGKRGEAIRAAHLYRQLARRRRRRETNRTRWGRRQQQWTNRHWNGKRQTRGRHRGKPMRHEREGSGDVLYRPNMEA